MFCAADEGGRYVLGWYVLGVMVDAMLAVSEESDTVPSEYIDEFELDRPPPGVRKLWKDVDEDVVGWWWWLESRNRDVENVDATEPYAVLPPPPIVDPVAFRL